ncbi:MAG: hypothetical protein WC710_11405 [Gallionella sp.]|jgi:hypothetical protein
MSTATDMLAKYLTAESALLEGKEVRFGDRMLKMEDLGAIRSGRLEWERRAASEAAKANRVVGIGGLSVSVASFNSAPAVRRDSFGRN